MRIVRQYRVRYPQGRTAGVRQRQGRVPGGGSGQAASKHSSGETSRGRGRQKTIRVTGNGPRSRTQKSNTGITLRKDSRGKSRLRNESFFWFNGRSLLRSITATYCISCAHGWWIRFAIQKNTNNNNICNLRGSEPKLQLRCVFSSSSFHTGLLTS